MVTIITAIIITAGIMAITTTDISTAIITAPTTMVTTATNGEKPADSLGRLATRADLMAKPCRKNSTEIAVIRPEWISTVIVFNFESEYTLRSAGGSVHRGPVNHCWPESD